MSIAAYIKEIGRGKEGARSLTREQAHDLMSQVLDGQVSDLEIGAFALAMRIKGESVAELAGFVDAVGERCLPIPTDAPTVLLPSYNGARKLPNLTVLLAMLLAQEGVQVLVHGPAHDPNRVTTAEIFFDLGLPIARDAADIHAAWARREPVFVRTEVLCEPLARLLDVRRIVGLRNSGHTVAKVLPVCAGALRVVNHTHPEYATLLADHLAASAADALLLRGTEGEPVADARRTPRIDVYIGGRLCPELGVAAHDGVLTTLPVLPRSQDAATTARYVQSVVSGAVPAPAPIVSQAEAVQRTLAAMRASAARERSA
jgi:anthranilate phosphoribosyltransferase